VCRCPILNLDTVEVRSSSLLVPTISFSNVYTAFSYCEFATMQEGGTHDFTRRFPWEIGL
jgi:hypothetical protein